MVNKCSIGRFDGEIRDVVFNDGDGIGSCLIKLNLSVSEGESIRNNNDTPVTIDDNAVNGETYYIVSSYKQGAEDDNDDNDDEDEDGEDMQIIDNINNV